MSKCSSGPFNTWTITNKTVFGLVSNYSSVDIFANDDFLRSFHFTRSLHVVDHRRIGVTMFYTTIRIFESLFIYFQIHFEETYYYCNNNVVEHNVRINLKTSLDSTPSFLITKKFSTGACWNPLQVRLKRLTQKLQVIVQPVI